MSVVYIVLSYGWLYYAYKYNLPHLGATDFYSYYNIYKSPLDFSAGEAPFIYRQFAALVTHALYELGVYYDSRIAFEAPGYDQRIFFAAIMSNYIALILTAIVTTCFTHSVLKVPIPYAWASGVLVLMNFATPFFILTGLADGWSWMLLILLIFAYEKRNLIVMVALLMASIFQRETLPVILAAYAVADIGLGRRFVVITILASAVACLLYLTMRVYLLPVSGHEYQYDIVKMAETLVSYRFEIKHLFQGFLVQNTLAVLLLFAIWAKIVGYPFDRRVLCKTLLPFLVLVLICMSVKIYNTIGRIGAMLTPIWAAYGAFYLHKLATWRGGKEAID